MHVVGVSESDVCEDCRTLNTIIYTFIHDEVSG